MVKLHPEQKFHQNRSDGSRVILPDGWTNELLDIQTEMGQILYLSFVKKDRFKMQTAQFENTGL